MGKAPIPIAAEILGLIVMGAGSYWCWGPGGMMVCTGFYTLMVASTNAVCAAIDKTQGALKMGRPKIKHAKRDSTTGRSRGHMPDEIVSVALANRVRAYGANVAVIKDDRTGAPRPNVKAGYPLGVLELTGQITPEQHNTGTAYANMVYRYCSMRGLPLPFPKSPSILFLAAGKSCGQEPDEQMVLGVRRLHADARRRLLEAGMAIGVGSRVNGITYAVCVEEKDALSITQSELGNLRVGLNALARIK